MDWINIQVDTSSLAAYSESVSAGGEKKCIPGSNILYNSHDTLYILLCAKTDNLSEYIALTNKTD